MDRRTAARQGENDRKTRRITRIQPFATKIRPKSRPRRGKTDSETTIYMPQKVAIDYMLNLCLALQLGIGSYKSAWLLLHKLRRAMVDSNRSLLRGTAEVDEVSVPFWDGDGAEGVASRGRGAAGRILMAGAVELSEGGKPRRIRLGTIGDYGSGALRGFIAGAVAPDAWVVTDGWSGYAGLPDNPREERVVGDRNAHEVLVWIHRVFSHLKRWALGVYHGLRRTHVQRDLDEFVFRWNRRHHRRTSFDSLLDIGLGLPPATYRDFAEGRA